MKYESKLLSGSQQNVGGRISIAKFTTAPLRWSGVAVHTTGYTQQWHRYWDILTHILMVPVFNFRSSGARRPEGRATASTSRTRAISLNFNLSFKNVSNRKTTKQIEEKLGPTQCNRALTEQATATSKKQEKRAKTPDKWR